MTAQLVVDGVPVEALLGGDPAPDLLGDTILAVVAAGAEAAEQVRRAAEERQVRSELRARLDRMAG